MASSLKLRQLLLDRSRAADPSLREELENGAVRCLACGHRCTIQVGDSGACRFRHNDGGTLKVPSGYFSGLQIDPIEKKPFFHVFPGRDALSFGMLGCNFHCSFCQNWVTSQTLRDDNAISNPTPCEASGLVDLAVEHHVPVIVSTYNEPLITAEWSVEVFRKAVAKGIVCGFVSNGHATPELLDFISPWVKLYKVDLKCFSSEAYHRLGGKLDVVLSTIVGLWERGFWVEVVTLVVPGFNDSDDELREMAEFLAGVSVDIPWHVTAFRPGYQMQGRPRTSTDSLVRACEIGKESGLRYTYPGNVASGVGDRENTFCYSCGKELICRSGYVVADNRMSGDRCPGCDALIPGVWEEQPPRWTSGIGMPTPVRPS